MARLVQAIAIWFFGYGLWEHDWRILVASGILAFIWPLIGDDVTRNERRQRELLDRLWDDDDDLSESA